MLITREEITEYIPQRKPFIAIHEIIQVTDVSAVTQFEVLRDSIFVTDGALAESGLIENMAQTGAAHMGYYWKEKGLPVKLGYLAGIKNLAIHSLPPVGAILNTSVDVTNHVMEFVVLNATVRWKEILVCQCEMRIYVENNQA